MPNPDPHFNMLARARNCFELLPRPCASANGMTVFIPISGTTWSAVAAAVVNKHQKDLDDNIYPRWVANGEGSYDKISQRLECSVQGDVMYKGGRVDGSDYAVEGSCEIKIMQHLLFRQRSWCCFCQHDLVVSERLSVPGGGGGRPEFTLVPAL